MSYTEDARSDARDMIDNFRDEIIEQLVDNGEASDDLLNDYSGGDSYHHENHVDKWYDLTDAAELLDELSDHEETDSGLWEGQDPKQAIGTQAAYTYGNAVYAEWRDMIEEINSEFDSELYQFEIDSLTHAELNELAAKYGIGMEQSTEDLREAILSSEKKRIAEEVVSQTVTV